MCAFAKVARYTLALPAALLIAGAATSRAMCESLSMHIRLIPHAATTTGCGSAYIAFPRESLPSKWANSASEELNIETDQPTYIVTMSRSMLGTL